MPANANPSPLPGEGSGPRAQIPWSKLAANGLHEIKPAAYRDAPSALAFALAFIGDRLTRRESASPLLWCLTERAAREWGAPYGLGSSPSVSTPRLSSSFRRGTLRMLPGRWKKG